jgi:hypothetical protein
MGGFPNYYRGVIRLPAVTTSVGTNTRRFGAFDTANGYFFEINQAQGSSTPVLSIVTRKASSDTPVLVFNGDLGTEYALDTNVHTYEIWYTNSKVYYFIDNILLHTVSATLDSVSATQSLKVGFQCLNAGGNTANNTLQIRASSILRLGDLLGQPISRYQSGITAGIILKYGPGNLHKLILSNIATTSVITLRDGTTAAGAIIHSFTFTGTTMAQVAYEFDFRGISFSTGLFLVIATAAANACVIFE